MEGRRKEVGNKATHQSGMSVIPAFATKSVTGFLITTASNSSGHLAVKWQAIHPP